MIFAPSWLSLPPTSLATEATPTNMSTNTIPMNTTPMNTTPMNKSPSSAMIASTPAPLENTASMSKLPMVSLNPRDQSASPTPTVNLSTSNSSLMPAVTSQNPLLSQLPQLSPTKFPNSSLTRSHSLQLTHKAPRRHTPKYFS